MSYYATQLEAPLINCSKNCSNAENTWQRQEGGYYNQILSLLYGVWIESVTPDLDKNKLGAKPSCMPIYIQYISIYLLR
jgi:hypothetical protein